MKNLITLALLAAPAAFAQNYVIQSSAQPYVPLTGGTLIPVGTGGFSSSDESSVLLTLPFAFPYYGSTYTQLRVHTNGFVIFDITQCTGFCTTGDAMPSTTRSMHNVIAPWWDDLQLKSGISSVSYVMTSSEFTVEWKDIEPWNSTSHRFTMKLTLSAGGSIQMHYGPKTGTGGSATVGFENATGTMGASLPLPPNNMPCSSTSASCTMTNFPTDTLYVIGQPVQPDLAVDNVQLNSVTESGGMLNVSITPRFRNFGQNAANMFLWRAYLSTDRTLQTATDIFLFASTMPLSVAGGMTVTGTASGSIATPPNGNYYVLVEADHTNVVAEGPFGESNNVGSTANYFVSGLDLVATSISGPAMSGPGNMMTITPNWFNQGTNPAGMVEYRVYLSTDNVYSTNDFELYRNTVAVAGGQTFNGPVTFTVPNNVPGGDFHYILRVNTATPPVTESMTNNTVASSGKVTMRQADLVIKAVDFVDVNTGQPTRLGLFGSQGRILLTAANEGGADARNFKVGIVISADTNLSLLQDTIVIEANVMNVPQGTTQVIDVPFAIPTMSRTNQPFTTGNYFWYALLDSSGSVTELNEFNNNAPVVFPGQAVPVLMSAPAPDLTVTRFDAPSTVGVGEIAPVYRVFKNIGNRPASDVKYRYYLSANAQVTTDDLPVKIVSNGVMKDFDAVTLDAPPAATSVSVATEMVEIPANVTPGTWYLGAVLDVEGSIVELDETNNGLASLPIAVAASSLRITTTQLPDAVIGRPYSFQLSVAGDVPTQPTTWAIDMAQGDLPMGLSLSMGGLLSGTPMTEAVVGITVTATNNGRTAVARLALRVLPTTTQVEITTPSLPSVVNSPQVMYETWLGAAGGVKPYTWSLVTVPGEVLPRNLALARDGKLSGFPAAGIMEKAYPITVEVKDSLGTSSRRQFNLRVVAPGAIQFTNLSIPDGLVGTTYLTDIGVRNFDGSTLAKPLTYRLVAGQLPDGIAMTVEQDVLLLQGTPKVAGTFSFTIEVEDNKGRNDSADFLLRIYPAGLEVSVNNMPAEFRPGDPVDFTFVVNGAMGVTFKLFSGALPPGTSVGADGHVTGTIASDNAEGTYNFVIEATDPTGATGIGAFSTTVKRAPLKQGCSVGGFELVAVGALAVLLRRRRR